MPTSYAATQIPDEISNQAGRAVASINWGNNEVLWTAPGSNAVLHRESYEGFSERTGKAWMPISAFEELAGVPPRNFVRMDYNPSYWWIGESQGEKGVFFAGSVNEKGTFRNSTFVPINQEVFNQLTDANVDFVFDWGD